MGEEREMIDLFELMRRLSFVLSPLSRQKSYLRSIRGSHCHVLAHTPEASETQESFRTAVTF